MLARILTENKNKTAVCKIASAWFPGFTCFDAVGFWQGGQEPSLILDIIIEPSDKYKVRLLAEEIKAYNEQQAVLIEFIENHSEMI